MIVAIWRTLRALVKAQNSRRRPPHLGRSPKRLVPPLGVSRFQAEIDEFRSSVTPSSRRGALRVRRPRGDGWTQGAPDGRGYVACPYWVPHAKYSMNSGCNERHGMLGRKTGLSPQIACPLTRDAAISGRKVASNDPSWRRIGISRLKWSLTGGTLVAFSASYLQK
jgi:hypothetical protein